MTQTALSKRRRRLLWFGGCGCVLLLGTVLLGTVATILVIALRPSKPVDPLDNVPNERLIWHGFGVSAKPERIEPSFLVGFEKAKWSSEQRDISQKLQDDGTVVHTMRSDRGSHVTTTPEGARIKNLKGTLKLADGRIIQLDRAYEWNKNGTVTIRDTSITTDARGQELRNNLVESIDTTGMTVSVIGKMISSLTGEHKINRTYTYIRDPEWQVLHTDHK